MTYAHQISKAGSHDELKSVGAKIFNAKLSKEKRTDLVKEYRSKRRELDTVMVNSTTNSTLKRALYNINNMAKEGLDEVIKTGKSIYNLTKAGIFNKHEADLVFRAYRYQKAKAGFEKAAAA